MTKSLSCQNFEDIRLIILDIDGTIAGESNEVNSAVIQALKALQKQGIQVILATGRMYCSALYFAQAIGTDLPVICYNGAWIKNPKTQESLWHLPVPIPLAEELLDFCEQPALRSSLDVHFYLDDQLYVREVTKETELYIERSRIKANPVGDLRFLLDQSPTKILAMSSQPEVTKALLAKLKQLYSEEQLYLTQSNPYFVEACNPGASKGKAVRYLVEEVLGLQAQNAIAMGDNFNDLEMLNYAHWGIAMGDAPPEVKAQADWVAPSVEEDGVVAALEKFIL
ncbi:HAD family phosphatase [Euhalothece natronophila Z-M001]|uniref:HAD family phosphatase n=1 Tax=Euhalothece natronophila Z-M001 TaxID=522448 RepID=A0A5B8NMX8_9CHRO|nr:Cof-type HAD-IIB family hydrolase [Euhalothece natronophila]QDZ40632.1 HAD family phosphatase [Euhalothece natronophila Z-M001]